MWRGRLCLSSRRICGRSAALRSGACRVGSDGQSQLLLVYDLLFDALLSDDRRLWLGDRRRARAEELLSCRAVVRG
jgi:hypothetical protein